MSGEWHVTKTPDLSELFRMAMWFVAVIAAWHHAGAAVVLAILIGNVRLGF